MGSSKAKMLSVPPSGTHAYFISMNCSPKSYKYLQTWQSPTKDNLEPTAIMGNIPNRQDH